MAMFPDIYPEGHGLNIILERDPNNKDRLMLGAQQFPPPDYVMQEVHLRFERLQQGGNHD